MTGVTTDRAATQPKDLCWYCTAEVGDAPFCVQCVKIQPLSGEDDFFAVFGLPRKLRIHEAALEQAFYDLSRKFHPDFYQGKSEQERQISLSNSAVVNQAYRTLRDVVSRAEYLVKLERGSGRPLERKAPADLLEEILAVQEAAAELRGLPAGTEAAEARALRRQVGQAYETLRTRCAAIDERLEDVALRWDILVEAGGGRAPAGPEKERLLSDITDLLETRSYVTTVLRDVGAALDGDDAVRP